MSKEGFKTLISQKLMEVQSCFCAYNFISFKATIDHVILDRHDHIARVYLVATCVLWSY